MREYPRQIPTLNENPVLSPAKVAPHSTTMRAWRKLATTVRILPWQRDASADPPADDQDLGSTLQLVPSPASDEWQPKPEPDILEDGAPKQILRAASPEFMKWMLSKLGALGANVATLTTHDAVHGLGAKWEKTLHEERGFGYGPPTSPACIRAITAPGQTSLYYFVTQHPKGEALREELRKEFGEDWQRQCFGRATHMLSHSWGMPFAGFINALGEVPPGSFVWNDILAINQHGDAGPLARAAMIADLNSLEPVIRFTKRVVLYFDPIESPAPLKRVWCLYEIMTLVTTEGFELMLGFTSEGRKELLKLADGFALKGGQKDTADVKASINKLNKTIKAISSRKATATVPSDEKMIKGMIEKKMGYAKFDNKVKDALTEVWQGFIGLVELRTAAATPGLAKDADAFVKVLKRVGKRTLPRDDIPFKSSSLNLSGKKLGANEAHALGSVLRSAKNLTSLDLLRNNLGVQGASAIVDAAKGKAQLATLCGIKPEETERTFKYQGLNDGDAVLLAFDLQTHTALSNDLGVQGASAVVDAARESTARNPLWHQTEEPSDFSGLNAGDAVLSPSTWRRTRPSPRSICSGTIMWKAPVPSWTPQRRKHSSQPFATSNRRRRSATSQSNEIESS